MFIYLIVNRVTGKYDVGQHRGNNLRKYLQTKLSDAFKHRGGRSYLFASMRKHGREAFTIHALLSDVETRAELDQHEKDFISFLRSQDPEYGYNICRGGEGFSGPHGPEAKAKVTEAMKKRWAEPGFKEHWSSIMTGHSTSPETIEKIKDARAGQDEAARLAAWNKNRGNAGKGLSHWASVLGGRAGSREAKQRAARVSVEGGSLVRAQHVRWHVNRGVASPQCRLCAPSVGGQ